MPQDKIKIFSIDHDKVVDAIMATGRANYRYAIENFVPLINRLEIQRKVQNPRFYERLKRDILRECLMPPITLAFIDPDHINVNTAAKFGAFVTKNIENGFILDGIQRLSTLQRAHNEHEDKFPIEQPIFVNILLCKSMDNLLYRMITLNNGQRPMTTRHQIEILTANLFNFSDGDIDLTTEKSGLRRKPGIFSHSDFVLGYMAFLSNSTNVDSQKLIQEKLDDLLASKILEHDPTENSVQFSEVVDLIKILTEDENLDKWFRINNNLIGFCAGIRKSYTPIRRMNTKKVRDAISSFEEAFRSFDVSKIKLGRARRNAVEYFILNAKKMFGASATEITDKLVDVLE
ncbi:hypothetical protein [Ralstonia flaminis]|jgi:hypothetical protein|uniref:DUF262 domain-containing protein n=1 Tax=Ralstonia flaminis TaxID=3058597 RepID=A0ABM9K4G7_9RALS|nr:hypothetical protein [Ralstonia sp. LMG 18101]CAJ0813219.1 hypothetical protein LMG18101_01831 [Ralstonia sp. LMG 18101]